jgi:hypothetical protein
MVIDMQPRSVSAPTYRWRESGEEGYQTSALCGDPHSQEAGELFDDGSTGRHFVVLSNRWELKARS